MGLAHDKRGEKRKYQAILDDMEHQRMEAIYQAFKDSGDLVHGYFDYMITEPIDAVEELKRVPEADYQLACALLTMLLREDHICNGSFERRLANGDVASVLSKMIELL